MMDFQGANLERANLSGADLRGADLSSAVLDGANLRLAVTNDSTNWDNAQYDKNTAFPNHYMDPSKKGMKRSRKDVEDEKATNVAFGSKLDKEDREKNPEKYMSQAELENLKRRRKKEQEEFEKRQQADVRDRMYFNYDAEKVEREKKAREETDDWERERRRRGLGYLPTKR